MSENKNLDIFLKVHPDNPALRLYEKVGFEAPRKSSGEYEIEQTDYGLRIKMDYKNKN